MVFGIVKERQKNKTINKKTKLWHNLTLIIPEKTQKFLNVSVLTNIKIENMGKTRGSIIRQKKGLGVRFAEGRSNHENLNEKT